MASTFNLTPSLPSSLDTLAGTSAYDVKVVRALVYSLFAVLSNSFLLTGKGVNKPVRVMIVPLFHISYIFNLDCKQPTGLATLPVQSITLPSFPSLMIAPKGAVSLVAVTTVTLSQSAQRDDKASPRNPKVVTYGKADKAGNLEV